jgi:hypothetical protein
MAGGRTLRGERTRRSRAPTRGGVKRERNGEGEFWQVAGRVSSSPIPYPLSPIPHPPSPPYLFTPEWVAMRTHMRAQKQPMQFATGSWSSGGML